MSIDRLEINLSGAFPPGVQIVSSARGTERIKELSSLHGLEAELSLEMRLFATYGLANLGGTFVYCQQFGTPGESIALLFLCGPKLREQMMFVFGTETKTDAEVDQCMDQLEPIIEEMGIQLYRRVCGDPNASIRVIDNFEIQAPLLLARARN